jgi:hypothetical protein
VTEKPPENPVPVSPLNLKIEELQRMYGPHPPWVTLNPTNRDRQWLKLQAFAKTLNWRIMKPLLDMFVQKKKEVALLPEDFLLW